MWRSAIILSAGALLGNGCILDIPDKNTPSFFPCATDHDCDVGFVCHQRFCRAPFDGGDARAGDTMSGDLPAPGDEDDQDTEGGPTGDTRGPSGDENLNNGREDDDTPGD